MPLYVSHSSLTHFFFILSFSVSFRLSHGRQCIFLPLDCCRCRCWCWCWCCCCYYFTNMWFVLFCFLQFRIQILCPLCFWHICILLFFGCVLCDAHECEYDGGRGAFLSSPHNNSYTRYSNMVFIMVVCCVCANMLHTQTQTRNVTKKANFEWSNGGMSVVSPHNS